MHIMLALPDRDDTGGGGLAYARGMAGGLRERGHAVEISEGDAAGWLERHAAGCRADGMIPVVDGMLLPRLLSRMGELEAKGAVALIHHAMARAGRDPAQREAVEAALHTMLPRMRRVVATSQPVADRLMQEFGLTTVDVVAPGADDWPRNAPLPMNEHAGSPGTTCRILSVGVLTPRKGHDILLRALAPLVDLDWTLTIAGAAGRDPAHAAQLAALIPELGLHGRVRLLTDPDEASLAASWRDAHLFALATRWEGYATAVAEALRRGIPVVTTEAGGALVPADAGAVCAIEDLPTLSKCLRRAVCDDALRADMAEAAWAAGQALPGWPAQAAALARVLGAEP